MNKNQPNTRAYFLLYFGVIIYSLSGVMNKLAAGNPLYSMPWFFWYACGILMLGIYALLWQQILKRLKLITAYANRALATPLGLFWGWLVFSEKISFKMMAGAFVIMVGIVVTMRGDYSDR